MRDTWYAFPLLRWAIVATLGAAVVFAAVAMTGCAAVAPKPVVLTVPVTRYVPIPDTLTAPCTIASPANFTVVEAVRVARERRASLERCNADKASIRAIQGTKQ